MEIYIAGDVEEEEEADLDADEAVEEEVGEIHVKETPDFSSPIRKASLFFLKSALNLHSAPPPTICSTVCCSTSDFSAYCCSIISSSTHPICLTASTKDGD
ncbi:hypothetical protein LWI29_029469 [Acer saccharum]|uniref:Uncharacterized protein n=1 Tax=Acer saccharum TaxID=4024 RepID=A0AA39T779_ACESA|nr:hypothetical protein LWI29_029469 [Acer saccharum]